MFDVEVVGYCDQCGTKIVFYHKNRGYYRRFPNFNSRLNPDIDCCLDSAVVGEHLWQETNDDTFVGRVCDGWISKEQILERLERTSPTVKMEQKAAHAAGIFTMNQTRMITRKG